MTTKAIADWLDAAVAATLTVTVYKGFPAWGRPTVTVPCAAILFSAHDPAIGATVGRSHAKSSTSFDVYTYAHDEIALWAQVDALQTYWKANATPSISSTRTRLRPAPIERLPADDTPEQARYACRQQVTFETL